MEDLINLFKTFAESLNTFCGQPIIHFNFPINCERLTTKYITQDIRYSEDFGDIFNALFPYNDTPCIYWFDSDLELDGKKVYELIDTVASTSNLVIPAHNKRPYKSHILYVGKVQSNIQGRLIQHLGVHEDQHRTHGIQLVHWINNYPDKINLSYHVVPLPKSGEWKKMAMLFEYALSEKLKPILGHHNG